MISNPIFNISPDYLLAVDLLSDFFPEPAAGFNRGASVIDGALPSGSRLAMLPVVKDN